MAEGKRRAKRPEAAKRSASSRRELTVEEVMQRAALAGIEVDSDEWELVTLSMNSALNSLAALRSTEQRQLEPAVRFEP